MIRQKRLALATLAAATLAVAGTATAASGAAAPTPGSPKTVAVGKAATPDRDLIAAAAKLRVTPDALTAAIIGAKQSFATKANVLPAEFIAAVADRLGLPAAQVREALSPLMSQPGKPGDKPRGKPGDKPRGKPGDKGHDGTKPADSPLASPAAAEAFAAATGVTVERAKEALLTLLKSSDAYGGLDPTSKAYRDVAAGLGLTVDQLTSALGQLKGALNGG